MSYSSDTLKKEYKKAAEKTRAKNLKKIREEVSGLSLSEFAKITGMTKNDVSCYESGDKTLSLFAILAYKKYFSENHGIDLSADFLMGFTDVYENKNMDFQNKIGLSKDAMETLMQLKQQPVHEIALEALNTMLAAPEKAIPLLHNTSNVFSDDTWNPCIAVPSEDGNVAAVKPLPPDQHLAFSGQEANGVLIIDNSILKSHAMLKIQEILNSYTQK